MRIDVEVARPSKSTEFLMVGRLLTNEFRASQCMGNSTVCSGCRLEDETVLHSLRDCPRLKEVWDELLSIHKKRRLFFTDKPDQWLIRNLMNCTYLNMEPSWAMSTLPVVAVRYQGEGTQQYMIKNFVGLLVGLYNSTCGNLIRPRYSKMTEAINGEE